MPVHKTYTIRPPDQLGDEASSVADDEENEDEERPDDAVTCPLFDTPWHHDACEVCGGRGWVAAGAVEASLGASTVPCVRCEGEGAMESGGPVTWTCETCLGTGLMSVSDLAEFDLTEYGFDNQDWRGADLGGESLRGAGFYGCDLSDVNFAGADLTDATFEECQFRGANPELAASLEGAVLTVYGLSEEQRVICVGRGATVEDPEDEEDGPDEALRAQR